MIIAVAGLAVTGVVVGRALMAHDRHVPISAFPLAPGAEVVATHEERPVDAAKNDTFARWLVIAGRAKESGRRFYERERYELVKKAWRSVTPPRAPGSYAALSPNNDYRLAMLTTAEVARARADALLIPFSVRSATRNARARSISASGRPILVAQIDRYVDFEVGTARRSPSAG